MNTLTNALQLNIPWPNVVQLLIAALYGIVEGISEWLPISSTGHMLLLDSVVSLDVSEDFWNLFLVVIQLGAILAVCVVFFEALNPLSSKKDAEGRRETLTLWAKTIVACLPAAIIGIPLDDWMEEHLGSPLVIASALIVYGVAFICIENGRLKNARPHGTRRLKNARPHGTRRLKNVRSHVTERLKNTRPYSARDHDVLTNPHGAGCVHGAHMRRDTRGVHDINWKTALGIGLFQVLSIVPGTSRSGATIIGGLLLGCSREAAAEFTFYLAIPVMFGASSLRLVKYMLAGNMLGGFEAAILGVGCSVAFIVSLAAIRFLMSFVRRHDFKPFGWYRIALGTVVIACVLAGVL